MEEKLSLPFLVGIMTKANNARPHFTCVIMTICGKNDKLFMQKNSLFVLLFISITTSAQNNAVEDTTAKPAITAIGKPDGETAEMKIGKEGGSFTSSDG